jgi:hypothetical protein
MCVSGMNMYTIYTTGLRIQRPEAMDELWPEDLAF